MYPNPNKKKIIAESYQFGNSARLHPKKQKLQIFRINTDPEPEVSSKSMTTTR